MGKKDIDIDLDDFSIDEIIQHLTWESDKITKTQLNDLKSLTKDVAEDISEQVLKENTLYQKIISLESSVDKWKMDVILKNLDKFNYLEICEIFEK
jgi:hypothetical protein